MKKVERFAGKDPRVRIFRNANNIGPGASRNHGIELAMGEYLSFMDSDDYVCRDFFERLYCLATEKEGHDIAKGIRKKVNKRGKLIEEKANRLNDNIRISMDAPL